MRRLGVIVIGALCAFCASAKLHWETLEYDFGVFHEEAGPQTGQVTFVNEGPEPTVINRVRTSCGCTGATFTEGEIAPGDSATVSFTYDPARRPGRFEKTVKVYTGLDNEITTIVIRGTVLGTPETLDVDYPVECGPLRLSERRIDAGTVRYGTARHLFFRAVNQSADTIAPVFESASPALDVSSARATVAPGDVLSVSVYLNTRDLPAPGYVEIPVTVRPCAACDDETEVLLTADVVPDTRGLSVEEVENGPRAYLNPELVDLGVVGDKGQHVRFEFAISNDGRSDLRVSRIYSRTAGVKILSWPSMLKPGKRGKATAEIDLALLEPGARSIRVEVVSNDPLNPVRTLRVALEKK